MVLTQFPEGKAPRLGQRHTEPGFAHGGLSVPCVPAFTFGVPGVAAIEVLKIEKHGSLHFYVTRSPSAHIYIMETVFRRTVIGNWARKGGVR